MTFEAHRVSLLDDSLVEVAGVFDNHIDSVSKGSDIRIVYLSDVELG